MYGLSKVAAAISHKTTERSQNYGQATSEFININLGEPTGYNTAVFVAQADHKRVQKRADILAAHKNSIRKLH